MIIKRTRVHVFRRGACTMLLASLIGHYLLYVKAQIIYTRNDQVPATIFPHHFVKDSKSHKCDFFLYVFFHFVKRQKGGCNYNERTPNLTADVETVCLAPHRRSRFGTTSPSTASTSKARYAQVKKSWRSSAQSESRVCAHAGAREGRANSFLYAADR